MAQPSGGFSLAAANDYCEATHGGHLANIYDERCYRRVRSDLLKTGIYDEYLIGMKYEKKVTRHMIYEMTPGCPALLLVIEIT